MLTTLKENISIGRVYRLEAGEGEVVDTYIHHQAGRGVNGVIIVVKGASEEVAHEIAVHAAFTKPLVLEPRRRARRARSTRSARPSRRSRATRASPRRRCPRSSRAGMNGWFKDRVLIEQSYVKDEKQTIAQFLGSAIDHGVRSSGHRGIGHHRAPRGPEAVGRGPRLGRERRDHRRVDRRLLGLARSPTRWSAATGTRRRRGRRQHLARRDGRHGRHEPGQLGPDGHARHGDQRAGPAGRHREPRSTDARALGDRHGPGRRALHPSTRRAPPRKGSRRHLRRRHGQSVLHDRHARPPSARPRSRPTSS